MRSSLIFGFIFLIIGGILGYIQYTDQAESVFSSTLIIGILIGAGAGLVLGSIMGYNSKSQSVKRRNMKIKQEEIEKKTKEVDPSSGVI